MSQNTKTTKPFLKWAGGKTQLIDSIATKFPQNKSASFSYIEPFVGSGAMLFWVLNNYPNIKKVVINDINTDLINCFKVIKSEFSHLIDILLGFELEYNAIGITEEKRKEIYYFKRSEFNTRKHDAIHQSALFIFLNRTCFNGLYRVNKKNLYNVPKGVYKKPQICNQHNLLKVSQALQNVEILNSDFECVYPYVEENSIIYFDPPYKPLSTTSSFNTYTKYNFDDAEQKRLKLFCDRLSKLNCKWILSNSDLRNVNPEDDFFDTLFKSYEINRVVAKRVINSNPNRRGQIMELLITN